MSVAFEIVPDTSYSLYCRDCNATGKNLFPVKYGDSKVCGVCGGTCLSPARNHDEWVNFKEPELFARLGNMEAGTLTNKWKQLGLPMPRRNGTCGFFSYPRLENGTIDLVAWRAGR